MYYLAAKGRQLYAMMEQAFTIDSTSLDVSNNPTGKKNKKRKASDATNHRDPSDHRKSDDNLEVRQRKAQRDRDEAHEFTGDVEGQGLRPAKMKAIEALMVQQGEHDLPFVVDRQRGQGQGHLPPQALPLPSGATKGGASHGRDKQHSHTAAAHVNSSTNNNSNKAKSSSSSHKKQTQSHEAKNPIAASAPAPAPPAAARSHKKRSQDDLDKDKDKDKGLDKRKKKEGRSKHRAAAAAAAASSSSSSGVQGVIQYKCKGTSKCKGDIVAYHNSADDAAKGTPTPPPPFFSPPLSSSPPNLHTQ